MSDTTIRDLAERLVAEAEDAAVERGEVIRLVNGGRVRADLFDPAKDVRETAEEIALRERKAWEAEHLGPNGDYVALDENRVVKKADYDPAIHGPVAASTASRKWLPVLSYGAGQRDDHCALCGGEREGGLITVGADGEGPVCEDCVLTLPIGESLWRFAEALDDIDTAIYHLPAELRAGMLSAAVDTIGVIAEWRVES